jgi:hypothetical protein
MNAVPSRLSVEGPACLWAGGLDEAARVLGALVLSLVLVDRGLAALELERDVLDLAVEDDRVVLLERLAGEDPRTSTSGSA